MGNWMCGVRRRAGVEDRLTKPQRLARQPSNVDYKKLRKLILSRKLAPCFDAIEDPRSDLEECPICFFYYPSLNRSRCCSKGICTECFLQMRPSNSTRPAQCPFCKTSSYAVEYRGAKTKEERELEIAEEQKVIEAKLRIQSRQSAQINLICSTSATDSIIPDVKDRWSTGVDNSRFRDFDAGAEEVMVLEAIWQSLQDSRSQRNEVDDPDSTEESDGAEVDTVTLEDLPLSGSHPTWTSDRTHRSTGPCSSSPCYVPGAVDRHVSSLPSSILTVS